MTDGLSRVVICVNGQVQGVGFRWWVQRQAERLGLVGVAANQFDGSVEVEAQGPRAAVEALIALLTERPGRGRPGRVSSHRVDWRGPDPGLVGFDIR